MAFVELISYVKSTILMGILHQIIKGCLMKKLFLSCAFLSLSLVAEENVMNEAAQTTGFATHQAIVKSFKESCQSEQVQQEFEKVSQALDQLIRLIVKDTAAKLNEDEQAVLARVIKEVKKALPMYKKAISNQDEGAALEIDQQLQLDLLSFAAVIQEDGSFSSDQLTEVVLRTLQSFEDSLN